MQITVQPQTHPPTIISETSAPMEDACSVSEPETYSRTGMTTVCDELLTHDMEETENLNFIIIMIISSWGCEAPIKDTKCAFIFSQLEIEVI